MRQLPTTFTADVKFDQGVTESFATYNNVSGVVDMDCDHGHLFYVTNKFYRNPIVIIPTSYE